MSTGLELYVHQFAQITNEKTKYQNISYAAALRYDKSEIKSGQKIEEAVALVPDMSAEQKLKAVQHWNVVSEKLQDIVNSSAADIGALALMENKEEEKEVEEMDANNVHDSLSSTPSVTNLNQEERLALEPISDTSYENAINTATEPINSATEPINSATEPINSDTEPLNSAIEPINSDTEPLNSATEPINSATEPINSATEPINSATEPINSATEPINNASEPINSATEPINSATESINWNENQLVNKTSLTEINTYEEVESTENSKKSNTKKQMSLSKKLAVLKEKESEIVSMNGSAEDLAEHSDKATQLLPEKSYAGNSELENKETNYRNSFNDSLTGLLIDIQDNNSQIKEKNAEKENSSSKDKATDLDQEVPTTKAHFLPHQKPHPCARCNLRFATKANLTVHMRRHTGERPFTCDMCHSTFTTRGNLKRHTITHSGVKPFQCTECNKCFTEKKTLKVHMRKHTGERPFKCTVCDLSFAQVGILQSHMDRHTNARDYLCDLCGKTFRQKSQLRLHQLRHDGAKKFSCTDCDMKFITKGDMERHIRRHTGEKPFMCDLCDKSFTRQQSLNEHKNRHSGRKPYRCKFCNKSFHEMSGCYKHTKTHCVNNEINASPKVVHENSTSISSTISDNPNSNVVTTEQDYNSSQPTTIQTTCHDQIIQVNEYSNSSKYLLLQTDLSTETSTAMDNVTHIQDMENHIIRNTDEKSYMGNSCDKTFMRQQSLNEHKNGHSEQKSYQCKHCDKTFYEMSDYFKHMKSHCNHNEINTSANVEHKNDSFISSSLIENHNSNTAEQAYSTTQETNIQNACQEQLIQVNGYPNSSKYLLQLQADLNSETPIPTDNVTHISHSVVPSSSSSSASENLPVEFSMISNARYPPNNTYG
ncbi:Zinc finger protein 33B [Nymphon striatum]|nr:Zinc finger protein 33B [Nymphon striatum]